MSKLVTPNTPIVLSTRPLILSLPFLTKRLDSAWVNPFIEKCWGKIGVVSTKGLPLTLSDQPTKVLGYLIHLEVYPDRNVPLWGTVLTLRGFPSIGDTSLGLRPVMTLKSNSDGDVISRADVYLEDL